MPLTPGPSLIYQHPRCALFHGTADQVGSVLHPNSVDALVTDPPSGIGFMGKAWDHDRGGRDAWVAWLAAQLAPAFESLKPGAHGLVWALPRTSHWTACALELCGFEIRDRVSALFGTGFPKSLDVSKAIDKAAGAERQVVGPNPTWRNAKRENQIMQPVRGGGAEVLTAPATADAIRWNGWGTALKPACEDWWLVRKPLIGTVAANVLAHGTGALNVDGCRIATDDDLNGGAYSGDRRRAESPVAMVGRGCGVYTQPDGRWPAHFALVHADGCGDRCIDGCPVAMLDAQSGERTSGARKAGVRSGTGYRGAKGDGGPAIPRSTGGASRFFYCAKPSPSERDRGLDHLPSVDGGRRNIHPTVKSIDLMRWLIRLITPPGGSVLDPFAGTGTTGIAALAEGCDFIGVEEGGPDGEYLPILEGRIRHAVGQIAPEGG